MTEQEILAFLRAEAEKYAMNMKVAIEKMLASRDNNWVPCEVGLPMKSGRYMVTIKNKGKRRTEMRNFDFASQTWESEHFVKDNIIAWQERPAPYVPKE